MKGRFLSVSPLTVIGVVFFFGSVIPAEDAKKPYPDLVAPIQGPAVSAAQVSANSFACAGAFAANNVTCVAKLAPSQFPNGATNANDVWGYVSPSGEEYAIVGLNNGTGFVRVTNPTNPVILANIPDASSIWSDVEAYQHYLYNVNENSSSTVPLSGLQIIDMDNIDSGTVTLVTTFTGLASSHTITINPVSGFLYTNGSNLNNGRLSAYNLTNPIAPVYAGRMADLTYVHDSFVISYTSGPAAGKEIAYCFCGSSGLKVVDVTVKSNSMPTLATRTYPTVSYCHQGWLTEDLKYLLIDDELDNLARTYVFDVQTPSNPIYLGYFQHTNNAGDHNLYIKDQFAFESNYTGGVRIFDVTTVGSVNLSGSVAMPEVGYHDTYIPTDAMTGGGPGTWSNYPYLPSGVLLVSNYNTSDAALFILDPSAALGLNCLSDAACSDGLFCNGTETCSNGLCIPGTSPCPGQGCDEATDICVPCDNNGVCETGEDCNTCPNDCFSTPGAACGNDVCEAANGEDCLTCPSDCNGQLTGKVSNRYCCGNGAAQYGVICADIRCTGGANKCTSSPAGPTCCGDLICGSVEDECDCAVDCGAPPSSEVPGSTCNDGLDNDCDGLSDSADSDCPVCGASGTTCQTNTQCCSSVCRPIGRCR